MRDNSLARSLIDAGHDVTMLPTYLPHFLDEEPASEELPIFFGGINVYLQHKFSVFRHTPTWIDKALDNKWLLKKAAARSGMTSSKDLGEITLSTFRGEDGPLAKEVRKVVDWFHQHGKPDIILLSTIMLAGIGKVLRRELNIPVYGFLQGEDSFLDSLLPEYKEQAWQFLRTDVQKLDGCITPSQYFGNLMAERLKLEKEKVLYHPNGITTEGFSQNEKEILPPIIGFLARLCPLKGLDILVDAFLILKKSNEYPDLRLEIAGGMTDEDVAFVEEQKDKLLKSGFSEYSQIYPNIKREEKLSFLKNLSVFSVPSRYPEAFGLYVIEALAAGTPVVLPKSGAFPEIIQETKGGLIYDKNNPETLAQSLDEILKNPKEFKQKGINGRTAVLDKYSNKKLAQSLVDNILAPALAKF
ncbi:MAG: glycosyltransferase family 4 protein [Opitutae bacterium]|jgi:glycosyltransferase involved in cell wall biosynthesis|nr:glycosyltransferase family 4 protein [Opitutae bacterium]MBT5716027.1 glycosyltransferase family 4 protein [Opitutae bacterium]